MNASDVIASATVSMPVSALAAMNTNELIVLCVMFVSFCFGYQAGYTR